MRTSEVFQRASAILLNSGWCQGTIAQDAGGNNVDADDPAAVAFCAVGACEKVGRARFHEAYETLANVIGGLVGCDFNDAPGRTKGEVVAAIDAAYILALQEEGLEPAEVLK